MPGREAIEGIMITLLGEGSRRAEADTTGVTKTSGIRTRRRRRTKKTTVRIRLVMLIMRGRGRRGRRWDMGARTLNAGKEELGCRGRRAVWGCMA
jgi:hypothetical protein